MSRFAGTLAPSVITYGSAVAVSAPADTTEDTLATITIPANAMGANGRLRVSTFWSHTNSANNKTLRVRYSGASGTIFSTFTNTTTAAMRAQCEIVNRNATNSQVGGFNGTGGFGSGAASLLTSSVDTTAATTVVITGQKASSGETLTLESYLVELIPGA